MNDSSQEGQTQYTTCCKNQFYLSFPLQFNFLVDLSTYQLGISTKVYFEVSSLDGWDVYRVEGYGICSLQIQPGNHSYIVSTWRPKGTFSQELRRYFIGTGQSLSDLNYLRNTPNNFEDRSGWRAESGGLLHLRLHTVTVNPSHLSRTLIKKQFRTKNKSNLSPSKLRQTFPKNELSPDFVKPSSHLSPGYFRAQPNIPFPRNEFSPLKKTRVEKDFLTENPEPVIEPLQPRKKKFKLPTLKPLTKPLLKGKGGKSGRLQALLKRSRNNEEANGQRNLKQLLNRRKAANRDAT